MGCLWGTKALTGGPLPRPDLNFRQDQSQRKGSRLCRLRSQLIKTL